MAHRISVKINGRSYSKDITSEQQEANIRNAVKSVNDKLANLNKAYMSVASSIDIVTVAAVNEGIEKCEALDKLAELESGLKSLADNLQAYVDKLK